MQDDQLQGAMAEETDDEVNEAEVEAEIVNVADKAEVANSGIRRNDPIDLDKTVIAHKLAKYEQKYRNECWPQPTTILIDNKSYNPKVLALVHAGREEIANRLIRGEKGYSSRMCKIKKVL